MNKYFYKDVPQYLMTGFCGVRDSLDNLINVLNVAEIINTSHHCLARNADDDDFDIAIFTGNYRRILIKKENGYFSMGIPFQIITTGERILFNSDSLQEEVSGCLISILRNCIQTTKNTSFSHEDVILSLTENFGLSVFDAIRYFDEFASLISDDHGYFRFDDDAQHQNGDFHPRYHFDFFYKNSTSLKIGYDRAAKLECIYSLIDNNLPKKYLTGSA